MLSILQHSFVRYLVSGGLATLLHLTILVFLVEVWNVHATLATSIGFVLASVLNYALQYFWTFGSNDSHAKQFPRYCAVTSATLVVNAASFWVLTEAFRVPYLLAQLLVTGVIVILNYEANRRFTFA